MLIEPFAPDWMARLLDQAKSLPATHQLHLLIDGAFVPSLHEAIAASRKVMLFAELPGCSKEALGLSPFLTAFDPDDIALQRLLLRCSGWPMVSVIETSEGLHQLAHRMAAWCVIEADGQRFHLRFADTRRIPAICQTLGPSQRAQLLGPAVRWAYTSRDGQWRDMTLDSVDADRADLPVLSDQQFSLLVEDSRIDEMMALFSQRDTSSAKSASHRYAVLSLALEAASTSQLAEPDLLAWCEFLWLEGQAETASTVASKFVQWQLMH